MFFIIIRLMFNSIIFCIFYICCTLRIWKKHSIIVIILFNLGEKIRRKVKTLVHHIKCMWSFILNFKINDLEWPNLFSLKLYFYCRKCNICEYLLIDDIILIWFSLNIFFLTYPIYLYFVYLVYFHISVIINVCLSLKNKR